MNHAGGTGGAGFAGRSRTVEGIAVVATEEREVDSGMEDGVPNVLMILVCEIVT